MEDNNILDLYKRKIDRLEKDNKRLREENLTMSKIIEGIKLYFTIPKK